MNKQQRDLLLEEMDLLLETFNEQYAQARTNDGLIPLIEVDIMKMTLQRLYQQMSYLAVDASVRDRAEADVHVKQAAPSVAQPVRRVMAQPVGQIITLSSAAPIVQVAPAEEKTSVAAPAETTLVENVSEQPEQVAEPVLADVRRERLMESVMTEPEAAPVAVANPAPAPVSTPVTAKQEAPKVVAQTGTLFEEPAPATIGNRYKEQETVYKKIAVTADDQRLAGKLQQVPLDDIRKSIGINDRFAFINELFGGNQQQYSENIEKLNSFSDYANARRLLYDELAVNFNWNKESKAFHQLDSLVKRRFSAG